MTYYLIEHVRLPVVVNNPTQDTLKKLPTGYYWVKIENHTGWKVGRWCNRFLTLKALFHAKDTVGIFSPCHIKAIDTREINRQHMKLGRKYQ